MKKKTDIMQIAAHEAMTIDQLLYNYHLDS
jgi:hypothetical protein